MSDSPAHLPPRWWIPQAWLNDFTDSRVREEVVKTLMKDNAVSFLTNVFATALFIWVHDFVRASVWFCTVLLLWCGLSAWSYWAERVVTRILRDGELTATQSWYFLRVYTTSSFLQTFCMAVILLFFMNHESQGIKSFEAIGMLFYYFGSVIKDFSIRLLNITYTLVLLSPIAIYYLWQGSGTGLVIAGFLLFFVFGAIQFANNMSRMTVSHIQQRFELETLTRHLTLARDRADAANAAKSQFFTAASHDARQPLQAITLLFDSIADSPSMGAADRKVIDKIGANLHSIRNLFDRVLDISRIESGSITPHFQAIPLQHIFNALDAQLGEFAASKNLWLRFAPTRVLVWHDADLLERMMGNVIHNALKFTQSGGVWVGYRVKRGQLEVRDSGVGITETEQARIFEEFYQLDNSARRRDLTAGLGLGLSIVKRLAELTHTPVGVRSAVGRGTTFWIGLNVARHHDHSPSAQLSPQAVPASTPITSQLKDLAILLVEDDAELRLLLARLLSERGAQVSACNDAPQACQLLSTTKSAAARFDVVLTDYRLGEGGNGADVVSRARQLFGETLPVVVLTGDTNGQGFQELTLKPHTQVLHKPVSIEQLAEVLQKAC